MQFLVLILASPAIVGSASGDTKVPCRITKEDSAVYATILRGSGLWEPQVDPNRVNGYTLAVKGDDWDSPLGPLGKRGLALMAHASKETMNDFISKRTKRCFIGSLKKRDLIKGPDLDDKEVATKSRKSSSSQPKYWEGFIRLSRIGFNTTNDEALVYVESGCGALCSSSDLFLLRKKDNGWEIVEHLTLALS